MSRKLRGPYCNAPVLIRKIGNEYMKCPRCNQRMTKVEAIFFKKIKEYNRKKEFYTHVLIVEDKVVEISINGSWKFKVYDAEIIRQEDSKRGCRQT